MRKRKGLDHASLTRPSQRGPAIPVEIRQVAEPGSLLADVLVVCAVFVPFMSLVTSSDWAWQHNFDDHFNFENNLMVQGWGWKNFLEIWTLRDGSVFENLKISIGMYEPISLTVKNLLAHFFGLKVTTYLVFNVFLHCGNAVLLRRVCSKLLFLAHSSASLSTTSCTVVAVALYSAAPLRIEVVAWASCTPYILAGFFSLTSLLCHLEFRRVDSRMYQLASCFAYLAGGFCKSASVPLPCVFVLIDVIILKPRLTTAKDKTVKQSQSVVLELISDIVGSLFSSLPLFGASCIIAYCQYVAKMDDLVAGSSSHVALGPLGAVIRCAMIITSYVLWSMPGSILVGDGLGLTDGLLPIYPIPWRGPSLTDPLHALSVIAITVVSAVLAKPLLTTSTSNLSAAWKISIVSGVAFVGMAFPSLIAPHGVPSMGNDRYTFLPCMWLVPVTALGIHRCFQPRTKLSKFVLAVAVLGYATQCYETNRELQKWRSDQGLWRRSRDSLVPRTETYLAARDDSKVAKTDAEKAHKLALARVHSAFGMTLSHEIELKEGTVNPKGEWAMGITVEAIESIEKALDVNSDDHKARVELGNLCQRAGRESEALQHYTAAIDSGPSNPSISAAYGQAGRILAASGGPEVEKGITLMQRGVELFPANINIKFELAHALQQSKRSAEAVTVYQAVVNQGHKGIRNWVTANKNLAIIYFQELPARERDYQKARELLLVYADAAPNAPDTDQVKGLAKHLKETHNLD